MEDYLNLMMYPCIGGLLIAVASSLHLWLKGRVTGFSGIVYNLWSCEDKNNLWRWSLVYGLVFSSCMIRIFTENQFIESQSTFLNNFPISCLMISGFLVGLGTKIGNGCTSGHGVCGLPRFSKRSFVAVICFMISGIVTANVKYHFGFFNNINSLREHSINLYEGTVSNNSEYAKLILLFTSIALATYIIYNIKSNPRSSYSKSDCIIGAITGIIFGFGLCLSGMAQRAKVVNFLSISHKWDPSLMFVLGVSVSINVITFDMIRKYVNIPPFAHNPISFAQDKINSHVIVGPLLFGIGWGLSGLCPGPVIVNIFFYFPTLFLFIFMLVLGQQMGKMYLKWFESKHIKSA